MRLKDAAAGAALGAGVFLVGGLALESLMAPEAPVPLSLGSAKVSIHLPTFNEEGWVGETLQSLVDQMEGIKVVVLDSNSMDATADVARRYTPYVLQVPFGKLSARDYGFRNDDADIVVSADAGDLYPPGWLSRLLGPFADGGVVAACGPVLSRDWLWKSAEAWYSSLIRGTLSGRVSARNSAIRTSAYMAAGGFDLSVDQLDRNAVIAEEEVRFPGELRKLGKVPYVYGAGMYATERHRAPFTLEDGRVEKYSGERATGTRF